MKLTNTNLNWAAKGLSVLALLITASFSFAQVIYPTYQGTNQRQGQNLNSTLDNPGQAFLTWFFPTLSPGATATILRDNTSTAAASIQGTWSGPANSADSAFNFFTATQTGNAAEDALTGAANPNPPYLYSDAVPSDLSGDPRQPITPGTSSIFQWTIQPSTSSPLDYALYVYLPTGPTTDPVLGVVYPQRYFVYEVDYGTNQTFVDVIDRDFSGGGFVRLGNGGLPTNALFHYDGTNPITIKVYNTIPRDANGRLEGVSIDSAGNLTKPYFTYADAVEAVPNIGQFNAQPLIITNPNTPTNPMRVIAAYNSNVSTQQTGQSGSLSTVQQQGTVSSLIYTPPVGPTSGSVTKDWTFSPILSSGNYVTLDAPSANVVASAGWTSEPTPPTGAFNQGPSYYQCTVTNTPLTEQQVTYTPTLPDGTYGVYLWLPGVQTPAYAKNVQIEIDQGATASFYNVDLTQQTGYVQVGGQLFTNAASTGNPLVVKITNLDTNPADSGLLAYADSVKFVGAYSLAVKSTPAYASQVPIMVNNGSGATLQNKDVAIVAGEDGRIYCVDADGNGNGTTNVYWAYPSLSSTTPDPNINGANAPDGTNNETIAEMPTGFNTSSALIEQVPAGSGNYFLYIASSNGRVYCISMTGRGDGNTSTATPGTTTRQWSYPSDYPSQVEQSLPSAFSGSLVYNNNTNGPTIFVPSMEGRLYALDALGSPATRTTSVKWAYPSVTAPTIGAIAMTPAIDGPTGTTPSIYFGTEMKNGVDPGAFYSLNVETGAVNWVDNNNAFQSFDGGLATAFNNAVGDGQNYIYASNRNGYIYAFSNTGAILWSTNELNVATSVPLTFTQIRTYNNAGTISATASPIVMVPTDDGNFYGLFAAQATTNVVGGKLAWGYGAEGSILAPMAAAQNYLVGTDSAGYLYSFSDNLPGLSGVTYPGVNIGVPNNPATQQFDNSKINFFTATAYNNLRQDANPNYSTYINPSSFLNRNPNAFDFGETLYIVLYDFPYTTAGSNVPPNINFQISIDGSTVRTISVQAQQFKSGSPANEDGYAIISFPIQAVGTTALAPGNGNVTFQINTVSNSGVTTRYFISPTQSSVSFFIANPIGIAMAESGNYGLLNDSLGADATSFGNPASSENLFNGAPSTPITGLGFLPSAMATSTGLVKDNSTGKVMIGVYDRSLLAILNGPDVGGLNDIRVNRSGLAWQGGINAVVDPVTSIYSGQAYEDYPLNFPNTSLDYPDISPDDVAVTKDPSGNVENPTFNGVSLKIPGGLFTLDANGNYTNTAVSPSQFANRTPNPTPFEFDVNVPQFQPANGTTITDTLGNVLAGGYLARINVFSDSNNNGILNLNNGHTEAFRSFLLGTGVPVDKKLDTVTPNVDLGTLAEGTGIFPSYLQANTYNTVYSPWTGGQIYKSFEVLNSGNVNLLNLRVAKGYFDATNNQYYDGPLFFSAGNNDLSYLDGTFSVYSDMDPAFSPSALGGVLGSGNVFTVKSRVTDASGTQVLTNPVSRITGNPLVPGYPVQNPRVTVVPPIGTPVGQYSANVPVMQDDNSDMALNSLVEAYTMNPSVTVSFSVGETRLTNSSSTNTQTMADQLIPANWNGAPVDSNIQPTASRDLYGDLLTIWASNRTAGAANGLLSTTTNSAYRLFFGSIPGSAPSASMLTGSMTNLGLTDLANFGTLNKAGQWAKVAGPYPAGPSQSNAATINTLFGTNGTSQHVVGTQSGENMDSVTFENPSFPSAGQVDPFNESNSFGTELFGFTGSAQVTGPTGSFPIHRLFMGSATIGAGANITYNAPVFLPSDGNSLYSKPSVVQIGNGAADVLFGQSDTGRSQLFYSIFNNGQFGSPIQIPLGVGFDSATDPSGIARVYNGVDQTTEAINGKVLEFAFSGKLRGQANSEIFFARMPLSAVGIPDNSNKWGTQLDYFEPQTENLTMVSPGLYRTRGVAWNSQGPISLYINGVPIDVVANGQQDSSTGIWQVTTSLGRAYLDPNVGTVRFVGAVPASNVVISIYYQPQILRISSVSTSGFTRPTLIWEQKLADSANYSNAGLFNDRGWFEANGTMGNLNDNNLRLDRWIVTYDRSSAGNGQSSHPMIETLRIGIPIDNTTLSPTPNGPYQVDPAQNQMYFTSLDEGNIFAINGFAYGATVEIERKESPIPIDNPANDGQVASFLDPFDPAPFNLRRPTLVWLFWTSSRGGTSDIYFETIAPAWYPLP